MRLWQNCHKSLSANTRWKALSIRRSWWKTRKLFPTIQVGSQKTPNNNCGRAIVDAGIGNTQLGRKKSKWASCQKVQQGLQSLVCDAKASSPVFQLWNLPSHLVHVVESNFKKHYEKIIIWRTNMAVSLEKKMSLIKKNEWSKGFLLDHAAHLHPYTLQADHFLNQTWQLTVAEEKKSTKTSREDCQLKDMTQTPQKQRQSLKKIKEYFIIFRSLFCLHSTC